MKAKTYKHLGILTLFVAAQFVSACSKASSSGGKPSFPIPLDKSSLKEVHFQNEDISLSYMRGYSISMLNTEAQNLPIVGKEPLAYLETCKNKSEAAAGELRFEQYNYKATGQDGKSHLLECSLMPVSEEWLNLFLEAFPTCMAEGLEAIELKKPKSVVVHSVMIYQHKGSSGRLSLHAPARAVDIAKFELVYADKSEELVVSKASQKENPKNKDETTKERKFFEAFRGCWSEQLTQNHGCAAYSKEGFRGSVGWEDSAHQNHLHLSRPFCPGDKNYKGG